jgi:hypothetical protein
MLFSNNPESPEAPADVTPRGFAGDRLERISPGLDRLRRKYGRGVVVPGSLLGRDATKGRDGTGPGHAAMPPEEADPLLAPESGDSKDPFEGELSD